MESPGPPDVWTQLSPVTLVTTGRRSRDRCLSATEGLHSCQRVLLSEGEWDRTPPRPNTVEVTLTMTIMNGNHTS